MSKKYICDICNAVIDDPYKAQMREFYIGCEYESGSLHPIPIKTFKTKIHICDVCFKTLKNAAVRKEN